jgi:hypothetical protein
VELIVIIGAEDLHPISKAFVGPRWVVGSASRL